MEEKLHIWAKLHKSGLRSHVWNTFEEKKGPFYNQINMYFILYCFSCMD